MKKILAFRIDRLGDYLICSKILHSLKKKYGHLTVVCSKANYKLIKSQTFIDEVILYDKEFPLFKKIKIFYNLFFNIYYLIIAWDGKKFSLLCSFFLIGKNKIALVYKKTKKIFNINFNFYRPSLYLAKIIYNKYIFFTSRNNLLKTEYLPGKYSELVSEYILEKNINYHLEINEHIQKTYLNYKNKFKILEYIFIHLDEKWCDINTVNDNFLETLIDLSKNTDHQIVISSYNNNYDYYKKLKLDYNIIKPANILFLENLEIQILERFVNYAKLNISCHSGFLVQSTGYNKANIIDIINENEKIWVSCWVPPSNVNYQQIFKNKNDKRFNLKQIFKKINNTYEEKF